MIFFKVKYTLSISSISEYREKFNYKICLKKKYKFINLKNTPTNALANRLTNKGNFLKVYKHIKYFYYKLLLRKQFKNIPLMSNFLFFYNKYNSFKDLDRVLFWKYNQLDCMFSLKVKKNKKKIKKKIKKTIKLTFITGIKRTLVCINFIKYIILLNYKRKQKNLTYNLLSPLYQYIVNDKSNLVIKLKYKLYRNKLIQLQS